MNTEKKAKISISSIIGIICMLILTVGVLWSISIQSANAEQNQKQIFQPVETLVGGYEPPIPIWQEEGYNSLKVFLEELKEDKQKACEELENKIDQVKYYLSEDQTKELNELKENIKNATSHKVIEENRDKANNILNNVTVPKVENNNTETIEENNTSNYNGSYYDFLRAGVIHYEGKKFTYYSQSVLPGGGLNIPGRHIEGGFVKDKDGYICLANFAANGTVVSTPFGPGKVYDKGTNGNHYDIYVE